MRKNHPHTEKKRNNNEAKKKTTKGRSPENKGTKLPLNWPAEIQVTYLTSNQWAANVPVELKRKYQPLQPSPDSAKPNQKVIIQKIEDPQHPAYGQYGLFARVNLEPRTFVGF